MDHCHACGEAFRGPLSCGQFAVLSNQTIEVTLGMHIHSIAKWALWKRHSPHTCVPHVNPPPLSLGPCQWLPIGAHAASCCRAVCFLWGVPTQLSTTLPLWKAGGLPFKGQEANGPWGRMHPWGTENHSEQQIWGTLPHPAHNKRSGPFLIGLSVSHLLLETCGLIVPSTGGRRFAGTETWGSP